MSSLANIARHFGEHPVEVSSKGEPHDGANKRHVNEHLVL